MVIVPAVAVSIINALIGVAVILCAQHAAHRFQFRHFPLCHSSTRPLLVNTCDNVLYHTYGTGKARNVFYVFGCGILSAMNRRQLLVGTGALASIVGSLEGHEADSNHTMQLWNGRAWKTWDVNGKTSWVEGFTAGYVWATIQASQLLKAVQPDKAQAFDETFKLLQKNDLVEGFTNLRIAEEVDRVYSDDNNLDLSLDMAIAHALHRLNRQYSESDLRDELGRFRALAIFSKTKEEPRK